MGITEQSSFCYNRRLGKHGEAQETYIAIKNSSEDKPLIRQPSAWLPIALSLAALAFLLGYVEILGITQNTGGDEGAPARIFQLLMAVQLPILAFFALKWLPKRPKQTLLILALQAVAWIVPIVAVIWLESL